MEDVERLLKGTVEELDRLLPYFAKGRFILSMRSDEPSEVKTSIQKVRRAGNL